ncbi:MAG: molybdate ABC transporter substrate-binding protein [Bacteroidales bacterium]|jgi:molybdate transport system substrate-binding protein|nr:molybdate ABC transporter substrate-binding protein [Bacteroidales bacterium]
MGKRILVILYLCFIAIYSLSAQTVTIAAAADLRFVMDELTNEFKKSNPKIKVEVIYGSSGNLYQQIVNQAPFDIFFSADISYPQKLDSLNLTGSKPKLYAIGHLVMWSASLDVSKGIELLRNNDVKKIAIANPRVAPYGKRAMECLKYYKMDDRVKDKIVEGENVSQAAQFVLTGNTEVGLIALSLALSPEMKSKGKYFSIDEKSYSKLEQAYVIIKKPETSKEVLKFTDYIETEQARRLFGKYGFKLPNEN